MRLKEIERFTVIHCDTKDKVAEIFKTVKESDYPIDIWDRHKENTCVRVCEGVVVGFDKIDYYIEKGYKITEFSDLIIPELSAKEVLEIMGEICNSIHGCDSHCPTWNYCSHKAFGSKAEETIAICTKWREEHPKEEEKKVEVEQFWEIKCLEDPSYHTTEHYKDEAEALRMCVILAEKDPKNSYYAVFVAKAKE